GGNGEGAGEGICSWRRGGFAPSRSTFRYSPRRTHRRKGRGEQTRDAKARRKCSSNQIRWDYGHDSPEHLGKHGSDPSRHLRPNKWQVQFGCARPFRKHKSSNSFVTLRHTSARLHFWSSKAFSWLRASKYAAVADRDARARGRFSKSLRFLLPVRPPSR